MSEMEVTEGQLLSQDFGVGGPPATAGGAPLQDSGKTPDILAAEIRTIKSQTGRMVLNASIEVGRRLTEAKATYDKMAEVLDRIAQTNGDQAAKLRSAVKAALEQMT